MVAYKQLPGSTFTCVCEWTGWPGLGRGGWPGVTLIPWMERDENLVF